MDRNGGCSTEDGCNDQMVPRRCLHRAGWVGVLSTARFGQNGGLCDPDPRKIEDSTTANRTDAALNIFTITQPNFPIPLQFDS
eukprot:scaffold32486_cov66-Cyclotella_meneghiniana.AAC.4